MIFFEKLKDRKRSKNILTSEIGSERTWLCLQYKPLGKPPALQYFILDETLFDWICGSGEVSRASKFTNRGKRDKISSEGSKTTSNLVKKASERLKQSPKGSETQQEILYSDQKQAIIIYEASATHFSIGDVFPRLYFMLARKVLG